MDVACATYACNGRHVEANSTYIQQVHALNGHILCAGLFENSINNVATNTAKESQGCFYCGCPISFANQIVSQQKHLSKEKNTTVEEYADVCIGDLYQATKQQVRGFDRMGTKLWRCGSMTKFDTVRIIK